jgi:hypothetical protein
MRELEARLSELAADGNEPRRDDREVQHLRKRMCLVRLEARLAEICGWSSGRGP